MKINDVRNNIVGSNSVEKVQSVNKEAQYAQQGELKHKDDISQEEKTKKVNESKDRELDGLKEREERDKRRHKRRRRRKKDKDKMEKIKVYDRRLKEKAFNKKGEHIDIKT